MRKETKHNYISHGILCWLLVKSLFSGHFPDLRKLNRLFDLFTAYTLLFKIFVMFLFTSPKPIPMEIFFMFFCTNSLGYNAWRYCNYLFCMLKLSKLPDCHTLNHCSCRSNYFLYFQFSCQMNRRHLSGSKSCSFL